MSNVTKLFSFLGNFKGYCSLDTEFNTVLKLQNSCDLLKKLYLCTNIDLCSKSSSPFLIKPILIKMKEIKIFITLILLGIIVAFYSKGENKSDYSSSKTENLFEDSKEGPRKTSNNNFDIPLPLQGIPEQIIYKDHYIVSYNKNNKIPNWVAWCLTSEHTRGDVKRPGNAWHEDLNVPTPRATPADYKGSGWTRGHMCPAGDNKWDEKAMYDTFVFSNCCPQNSNLNSGTWNQIEIASRRWAEKYGKLYIVCGPILFRQEHETIGENKVVVPEAFFKVIVCLDKEQEKGIGFICRNTDGNRNKDQYVNSIKQVERITGITFFPHLKSEIANKVKNKANIGDWE